MYVTTLCNKTTTFDINHKGRLMMNVSDFKSVEYDVDELLNGHKNGLLSLPDETMLFGEGIEESFQAKEGMFTQALITRRELGSRTQPLILTTKFVYSAGDLFPADRVVTGLVIIGGILVALVLVIKLVSKTRSAEQRARLGEQDARIAHASRVNALGEIASGMAHELNQPLTAILSQSQAGVRLVNRDDLDPVVIEQILQSNVTGHFRPLFSFG